MLSTSGRGALDAFDLVHRVRHRRLASHAEINPKLEEFARHYARLFADQACDAAAQGQGGKRSEVCAEHAVKGRSFESLAAQNRFLSEWSRMWPTRASTARTPPAVGKTF